MSRITSFLSRGGTEHRCDIIRITAHRVKELAGTRRLEMRHRRLDQMSGAVKFMLISEIAPSFFRFDNGEMNIQIPVFLLRSDNQIDQFIQFFFHCGIGMNHQHFRHAFQNFRHIGIPEDMRLFRFSFLPLELECFQPPRFFAAPDTARDRNTVPCFLPRCKNRVQQFDFLLRDTVIFFHGKILF